MSTLVDELLQDFEESGSEAGDIRDEDGFGEDASALMTMGGDVDMDVADLSSSDEDEEMDGIDHGGDVEDVADKPRLPADKRSDDGMVRTLEPVLEVSTSPPCLRDEAFTSLLGRISPDGLAGILQKIAFYQAQSPDEQAANNVCNIEDRPEYHLLTESNGLSASIDTEINVLHKFIRDHYTRFPELEMLITQPLDYAHAVAILGNGAMDSETMKKMPHSTDNPLRISLDSVLDRPTLMIVTTSAITTKGQPMPQEELDRVVYACQMVIKLDKAKKTLTEYVQSRMNKFAPNLTALIGSLTAAQLLNEAGGLNGLSKSPACNIAAWGSKRGANAGALAAAVGLRRQGYLFQSPLIRSIPSDLKKQAMRIVSAKLVLAARVDRVHSSPDGRMGEELRDKCVERLDKLQERPLNKGARALPAPDDKPARKRGGRRARKAKEATAMP